MIVGTLLFDGFELMDSMAPFSLLMKVSSSTPDAALHQFCVIGESINFPIESTAHSPILPTIDIKNCPQLDVLLIPGGVGTFATARNPKILKFLRKQEPGCQIVMSICTGSSLLANAGFLSGRRATSNKMLFDEQATYGSRIEWVREARFVMDGKFVTASGVSAGVDATYAVSQLVFGNAATEKVFSSVRYEPLSQDTDPFAKLSPRKSPFVAFLSCLKYTLTSKSLICQSKSFPLSRSGKQGSITTLVFDSFDFLDVATVGEALLAGTMTHYIDLVHIGGSGSNTASVKDGVSGIVELVCDRLVVGSDEAVFDTAPKLVFVPTVHNPETLRTPQARRVFDALSRLPEESPVLVVGTHAVKWIAETAQLGTVDLSKKGFKRVGKWMFSETGFPAIQASLTELIVLAGKEMVQHMALMMELSPKLLPENIQLSQ
ncbi:class I glutamine amidotransferase-like protein [Cladochytrium replicatum]|nr:class I glutamine amidotransferase-like protein [Cladochytrium replicatum]